MARYEVRLAVTYEDVVTVEAENADEVMKLVQSGDFTASHEAVVQWDNDPAPEITAEEITEL